MGILRSKCRRLFFVFRCCCFLSLYELEKRESLWMVQTQFHTANCLVHSQSEILSELSIIYPHAPWTLSVLYLFVYLAQFSDGLKLILWSDDHIMTDRYHVTKLIQKKSTSASYRTSNTMNAWLLIKSTSTTMQAWQVIIQHWKYCAPATDELSLY